jgi:HEPN domain-containing protein
MSVSRSIELARAWLLAAESDLAFAELGAGDGFYSQACFQGQQAAEKALKAYLFAHDQELLRTHSLPRLLQECLTFDERLAELGPACATLTAYYIETRYPDSFGTINAYSEAVAREALRLAAKVLAQIRESIGSLPAGGN